MKDTALAMAKRLLMDSIWKSANLEGLGTTYQKTEAIIRNAPTITTAIPPIKCKCCTGLKTKIHNAHFAKAV